MNSAPTVERMQVVAEVVPAHLELAIRADERHKLAALLEGYAATLTEYAADKDAVMGLVIVLLRLDEPMLDAADSGGDS